MLENILKNVLSKFDIKIIERYSWIDWIITDKGNEAKQALNFLNLCYSNLNSQSQDKIKKEILKDDLSKIESTLYELITHELLYRLNLNPEFYPSISNKTPDICFNISNQKFLVDVFVTHSPEKTVFERDGFIESRDCGDRADKIADTLIDKTLKYSKTGFPLVLFVFLGDHNILDIESISEALLGVYRNHDTFKIEDFKEMIRGRKNKIGLFLPNESGKAEYKNLSAVVACDWFDTLNKTDTGKRLYCLVYHHWDALFELPIQCFEKFCQMIWNKKSHEVWQTRCTTEINTVAKLPLSGGIEYNLYTPNNPW